MRVEWFDDPPGEDNVSTQRRGDTLLIDGLPSFRLEPGESVTGELSPEVLEFVESGTVRRTVLITGNCDNSNSSNFRWTLPGL